jgi:hypothetical protein
MNRRLAERDRDGAETRHLIHPFEWRFYCFEKFKRFQGLGFLSKYGPFRTLASETVLLPQRVAQMLMRKLTT